MLSAHKELRMLHEDTTVHVLEFNDCSCIEFAVVSGPALALVFLCLGSTAKLPPSRIDKTPCKSPLVPAVRQVSTYPVSLGSYHIDSGTSMSAPETAGCIALFLQAQPGMYPYFALITNNSQGCSHS